MTLSPLHIGGSRHGEVSMERKGVKGVRNGSYAKFSQETGMMNVLLLSAFGHISQQPYGSEHAPGANYDHTFKLIRTGTPLIGGI